MNTNVCRVCGIELNVDNWSKSCQKGNERICKKCSTDRTRLWIQDNHQKQKQYWTTFNRKRGSIPFSKNKKCSMFLGVYVAERLLSNVFKNVKKMPYGYRGYDFICNRDKLIDVKSACLSGSDHMHWSFQIGRNTIPDYFLCLAFDNREDLTPMYVWMVPGNKLNRFTGVSISPNTVNRWNTYAIDITKIIECCDTMKHM